MSDCGGAEKDPLSDDIITPSHLNNTRCDDWEEEMKIFSNKRDQNQRDFEPTGQGIRTQV